MPWRKKEKSCKDSLSGKPEGCGFTSSACDAVRALLAAGAAVDEDHALERAAACAEAHAGPILKCIFEKCIFEKCIFRNAFFQVHVLPPSRPLCPSPSLPYPVVRPALANLARPGLASFSPRVHFSEAITNRFGIASE